MAINTAGFQVGVLPQYTPIDPHLASLDPSELTHGLLSAYQLAGTASELTAFRQHAQEIADTEGIRTKLLKAKADQAAIERDHAQAVNQAAIDAELAQHSLDTAKAKNLLQLEPLKTKVAEAAGNADLSTIGPAAAANVASNNLSALNSNIGVSTATDRAKTAQTQAAADAVRVADEESLKNANLAAATLAARYAKDIAPDKQKLIVAELKDKLESVQSDKERKDALADAEIAFKKAQTKEALGHADYFDAGGKAANSPDPIAQLGKINTMVDQKRREKSSLENSNVPNPDGSGNKITLSQYLSMTRDNGKIRRYWFGYGSNKALSPEAEAAISQVKSLESEIQHYSELADVFSSKITPANNTQSVQATLPSGWTIKK